MKPLLSLATVLILLTPDEAAARTLSCQSRVFTEGDPAEGVRQRCGEPASVKRETRLFSGGGTLGGRCFHGSVNIETWRYARGGVPVEVTVVDGKVERIRSDTGGFDRGWTSPCN